MHQWGWALPAELTDSDHQQSLFGHAGPEPVTQTVVITSRLESATQTAVITSRIEPSRKPCGDAIVRDDSRHTINISTGSESSEMRGVLATREATWGLGEPEREGTVTLSTQEPRFPRH